MTLLKLKAGIIYGPVKSRRLGHSLGINLLPTSHKLCSFDCIYCHCGRTQVKTLFPAEDALPVVEEVLASVAAALQVHPGIDYLTFSGNGEATLHPRFPEIVSGVCRLRDRLRPEAKLAILSNSTALQLPQVRETLLLFDAPIMKLDAGDAMTLARINHPPPEIRLEDILSRLKTIPALTIQSVLIDGEVTNVRGEAYEAWLTALSEVRPACVQIYSTDRPVPEAGVQRVSPSTLKRIAGEIEQRMGIPVDAYWAQT